MHIDIRELVGKARQGDKVAFGELYLEYFAPIYRFIYFKIGHKETAEDITQAVFTKALSAISTFADTGVPVASWLYTIARNACIDHYKKKRDVTLSDDDNFWQDLESDMPGPEQDRKVRERSEILQKVMRELSEEQRELVLLRFIEEQSYEEIAKILQKSEES
ncbi:MAG: sigma-70 family RNA polymerase sigma factor, partial [Patescibacteria group bacterium]